MFKKGARSLLKLDYSANDCKSSTLRSASSRSEAVATGGMAHESGLGVRLAVWHCLKVGLGKRVVPLQSS